MLVKRAKVRSDLLLLLEPYIIEVLFSENQAPTLGTQVRKLIETGLG